MQGVEVVMDLPSETRIWRPQQSGTLTGVFHLLGGLNWAVRTEDGSVWLLEADAENQLESLDPVEGQVVQVFFIRDGWGRPGYHVSLLPEMNEEDVRQSTNL
jgi:hypothetical protein